MSRPQTSLERANPRLQADLFPLMAAKPPRSYPQDRLLYSTAFPPNHFAANICEIRNCRIFLSILGQALRMLFGTRTSFLILGRSETLKVIPKTCPAIATIDNRPFQVISLLVSIGEGRHWVIKEMPVHIL